MSMLTIKAKLSTQYVRELTRAFSRVSTPLSSDIFYRHMTSVPMFTPIECPFKASGSSHPRDSDICDYARSSPPPFFFLPLPCEKHAAVRA